MSVTHCREKKIRKSFALPLRNIGMERMVLSRAFSSLEANPTDAEVCRVVSAHVDAVTQAERDDFGAIASRFVGPMVSPRPVLQSTNQQAWQVLSEALDLAGAGRAAAIPGGKRRRVAQ
jgi:hypothetical protein